MKHKNEIIIFENEYAHFTISKKSLIKDQFTNISLSLIPFLMKR